MALKKQITVSGQSSLVHNGVQVSLGVQQSTMNCYIKVETVSGGKSGAVATVSFTDGDKRFVSAYEFQPEMSNENFIAQAYKHLKTMPEFSSAEDC